MRTSQITRYGEYETKQDRQKVDQERERPFCIQNILDASFQVWRMSKRRLCRGIMRKRIPGSFPRGCSYLEPYDSCSSNSECPASNPVSVVTSYVVWAGWHNLLTYRGPSKSKKSLMYARLVSKSLLELLILSLPPECWHNRHV